ncbi:2-hydroxyacyl-CoA dehydratase [Patescibacteria group bacterium]
MAFSSLPALHSHLAMRAMFQYFGKEFIDLPDMTEDMLTWGEAKSPEYACLPYKVYLGYFKKLAEMGQNDVFVYGVRSNRACRYMDLMNGFQKTLRAEGFTDFTMHYWGGYGVKKSFAQLKKIMGGPSFPKMLMSIFVYSATLEATDELDALANKARPREIEEGSADRWLKKWLAEMKHVSKRSQPYKIVKRARDDFSKIEQDEDRDLVKLAFAGDLFKIHEPFFHFDTIRKLNKLGAEVKQPQTFSLMFMGTNKIPTRAGYRRKFVKYQQLAKKYLRSIPASYFDMGIGEVIDELDSGAQGIVHFQSFGCMPDIMFKPILDKIGQDYGVPVIHYMRDTHASDTAYQTRLEAFVDLIKRKENTNA